MATETPQTQSRKIEEAFPTVSFPFFLCGCGVSVAYFEIDAEIWPGA
jgi:hypothetical protein